MRRNPPFIFMLLAGTLLDLSTRINPADSVLPGYRLYFGIAFLLLVGGVWIILRLTPLPLEKRKIKKSWSETV